MFLKITETDERTLVLILHHSAASPGVEGLTRQQGAVIVVTDVI